MPCKEWFDAQDAAYRDSVIPPSVRARVAVEAGVSQGWRDVIGDAGRFVGIEHFGASAAYETLYEEFGITAGAVAQAARDSLLEADRLGGGDVPVHARPVRTRRPRRQRERVDVPRVALSPGRPPSDPNEEQR
jgi:transketolase